MSGSGDAWDPKRPDGSYYNPFPDGAAIAGSGTHLPPTSNVGLFGSGYTTGLKNQTANGTLPSPADFGAPTDSSDPLKDFGRREAQPNFPDLEIPES